MPVGHHTDQWFEQQNRLTGQPHGARHSDAWYAARQQGPPPPAPPGQWLQGQQQQPSTPQQDYQAFMSQAQALIPGLQMSFDQYQRAQTALFHSSVSPQNTYQMGQMSTPEFLTYANQMRAVLAPERAAIAEQEAAAAAPPPPPPPPPPSGPTAAEIAAAAALAQTNAAKRRNDWDLQNKQGLHDPDGWQSIGFQPDHIPMPDWWRDAAVPAAPIPQSTGNGGNNGAGGGGGPGDAGDAPPLPPTVPAPPAPNPNPSNSGAGGGGGPGNDGRAAPNALARLLATPGSPQAATAATAQQAAPNWGGWGQGPTIAQPVGIDPNTPQSWMQGAAFGAPNQAKPWAAPGQPLASGGGTRPKKWGSGRGSGTWAQ